MNLEQIDTGTKAGKLSPAQKKAIRDWSLKERFRGSYNPTMVALSRAGLVYWCKPTDILARGHWSLDVSGHELHKKLRADLAGEAK